jgi:hypothetical protein
MAAAVATPALVFDEAAIVRALERAAELRARCGCKVLYALKALCCPFVLELMRPWLDGFATSSLLESRLARSVLGDSGVVHITTPGFRPAEIEELDALCDRISFNSLGQLSRFGARIGGAAKVGLRVNPRVPLVADARYNPCRPDSKLGVPLERLLRHRTWTRSGSRSRSNPVRLHGLHFHTNCDSDDWGPLLGTVRHLEAKLRHRLAELEWINLGGGYLLGPEARTDPLIEAVSLTFLQSILKGLQRSPRVVADAAAMLDPAVLTARDVSCLVIPDGCLGLPVLAALEQGIAVIAVRDNRNLMHNDLAALAWLPGQFTRVENYLEAVGVLCARKAGLALGSVRRPIVPAPVSVVRTGKGQHGGGAAARNGNEPGGTRVFR